MLARRGNWYCIRLALRPPKAYYETIGDSRKLAARDGCAMLKLSISLPNSTQITLESEDPAVIHEVLGIVLRRGMSPPEAAPPSVPAPAPPPSVPAPAANGHSGEHNGVAEKGNDVTPAMPDSPPPDPASPAPANGGAAYPPAADYPPAGEHPRAPVAAPVAQAASVGFAPVVAPVAAPVGYTEPLLPANDDADDGLFLDSQPAAARDDFISFCQNVNPMGDMRRVVVAAEGAGRFFRADGVNADELGELFDLAGWRRANSFTQTLRNAARSKFGWLERIPGRSGRYAATDLGREVTLGG